MAPSDRPGFTEKNARRREGRARVGRIAYNAARNLRRACGGVFGNLTGPAYIERAVGTHGEERTR